MDMAASSQTGICERSNFHHYFLSSEKFEKESLYWKPFRVSTLIINRGQCGTIKHISWWHSLPTQGFQTLKFWRWWKRLVYKPPPTKLPNLNLKCQPVLMGKNQVRFYWLVIVNWRGMFCTNKAAALFADYVNFLSASNSPAHVYGECSPNASGKYEKLKHKLWIGSLRIFYLLPWCLVVFQLLLFVNKF